ncbi:uncharacterized protein TRAVEDRAFT_21145 [Trametes versicolor FP-101664 SS1]|uniref:uncharacterized protein n=1 Tax=Trametes versicolor (strain FP-101664) TaxID=717944 RepID=UPI000462223B|nr:uncharacterized protein TRAVEDRAFT_21145 [Trametes versicolor FP-101664 SS1]EIW57568.1 hypothetical protein TRAVEDRAFT_21145 [Trametes versicolor FP-101664 SS1]
MASDAENAAQMPAISSDLIGQDLFMQMPTANVWNGAANGETFGIEQEAYNMPAERLTAAAKVPAHYAQSPIFGEGHANASPYRSAEGSPTPASCHRRAPNAGEGSSLDSFILSDPSTPVTPRALNDNVCSVPEVADCPVGETSAVQASDGGEGQSDTRGRKRQRVEVSPERQKGRDTSSVPVKLEHTAKSAKSKGKRRDQPPGLPPAQGTYFVDADLAAYLRRDEQRYNLAIQQQGFPQIGNETQPPPQTQTAPPQSDSGSDGTSGGSFLELDVAAMIREQPEMCKNFLKGTNHAPSFAPPQPLPSTRSVSAAVPTVIAHIEIPPPPVKLWQPKDATLAAPAAVARPSRAHAGLSASAHAPSVRSEEMDVDPPDATPAKRGAPLSRTLSGSAHAWPKTGASSERVGTAAIAPTPAATPVHLDPDARSAELTRTGILRVMETPRDGFPTKHARGPLDLVRDFLRKDLNALRTCKPGTCFGVELHGMKDTGDEEYLTRARRAIVKGITALTGMTNFRLNSPPRPSQKGLKRDSSMLWTVSSAEPGPVRMLVAKGVWPTDFGALHIHDLFVKPTRFCIKYMGFVSGEKAHVRQVITENFLSAPFLDPIIELVATDPNLPAGADAEAVARGIVESFEIVIDRVAGGPQNGATTAAIYADPPTSDEEAWTDWNAALRKQPLVNRFGPHAIEVYPLMRCAGCHAGDHVRANCPFEALPGWFDGFSDGQAQNGQPATPRADARAASHDATRVAQLQPPHLAPSTAAPLAGGSGQAMTPAEHLRIAREHLAVVCAHPQVSREQLDLLRDCTQLAQGPATTQQGPSQLTPNAMSRQQNPQRMDPFAPTPTQLNSLPPIYEGTAPGQETLRMARDPFALAREPFAAPCEPGQAQHDPPAMCREQLLASRDTFLPPHDFGQTAREQFQDLRDLAAPAHPAFQQQRREQANARDYPLDLRGSIEMAHDPFNGTREQAQLTHARPQGEEYRVDLRAMASQAQHTIAGAPQVAPAPQVNPFAQASQAAPPHTQLPPQQTHQTLPARAPQPRAPLRDMDDTAYASQREFYPPARGRGHPRGNRQRPRPPPPRPNYSQQGYENNDGFYSQGGGYGDDFGPEHYPAPPPYAAQDAYRGQYPAQYQDNAPRGGGRRGSRMRTFFPFPQ